MLGEGNELALSQLGRRWVLRYLGKCWRGRLIRVF